jgi:autotransporter-associated beta strand protein
MKRRLLAPRLIAIIFAIVSGSIHAHAATYTWTQTNLGSQDWTVGANWDGIGVYQSGANNELRFFADITTILDSSRGTQIITTIPAARSLNTLTLNGRGPNSTIGFAVIIGDSTSTWTIGDGTTSTINLNSTLGGGSADRDVRYTIAPNLILNQTTTTFTGNSTSVTGALFTGNITESAAGYGITKSGSHLLILSGANTYSGTTTVSAGTLRLLNESTLPGGMGLTGGTSALTISGTGVVELGAGNFQRNLGTGSSQFQITGGTSGFSTLGAPRLVMVNNDATTELVWGGASFAPSTLVLNAATANNALWLANKINLSGTTRTVQVNANTAILSGDIRTSSGTAGLTKTGAGTLVLAGNNTYNGNTTISAGTLSVGTAGNLGSGSSGLIMSGGTLQITGTTRTSITGLGHAVTLSGATAKGFDIADAANTFTVDQAITGTTFSKSGVGILVLNQDNSLSGATTVTGGGTLVLDYSTNNGSKIGNAALNLNGGNLVLRGGSGGKAVTSIVLGGATGNSISRDGGSTATIANAGVLTINGLSNLAIAEAGIVSTTSANVNGIQTLGGVTVGSDFATKDGSDLLQAYSTYTPYTAGGGGGSVTAINQLTGGGTMSGTLTSYSLKIANSTSSDVLNLGANNLSVVNGGTVLYAGGSSDNYIINGSGAVRPVNGNQPMTVNVFTGTLTVNSILTSGGSSTLAKAGAGTLVAGGASGYTGATYVQQGVLRLANASGLGSTAGGTIVQGGAALELTNNITVGAEALTLSGVGISNGGAMRNCSGTNTYGGAVTIGGGGARINSDSGTLKLTGGITTTGGQNLTFGGAGVTIVSNSVVVGAGNLIKDGSGTLDIGVTDNTDQWVCGDMALNASSVQFSFAVAPSTSVAPLNILGNLTFAGTPTIKIAVDRTDITTGEVYPLLVVSGSAPTTVPTLEGFSGALSWGGPGNRTLFLITSGQGSVYSIR